MSTIRDLILARTKDDARPEVRCKIYLDVNARRRIVDLEAEIADLRAQAEGGAKVKLNGRLPTAENELEAAEKTFVDSLAYVVLRVLTSEQMAVARMQVTDDDPTSKFWIAQLRLAFVRMEGADGTVADDVTAADWAALLHTMSSVEIFSLHGRLSTAEESLIPS